jgi:HPt (histidine-containing phosphotransfer) domain-containing protein
MKKIWSHYSNNELEDVANLVHKIKPGITFMGIHQLKDLAPEIEDLAKNKSADLLKKQLEEFERIYQEAIAELKHEFNLVK